MRVLIAFGVPLNQGTCVARVMLNHASQYLKARRRTLPMAESLHPQKDWRTGL
jgi:hypothetical protein